MTWRSSPHHHTTHKSNMDSSVGQSLNTSDAAKKDIAVRPKSRVDRKRRLEEEAVSCKVGKKHKKKRRRHSDDVSVEIPANRPSLSFRKNPAKEFEAHRKALPVHEARKHILNAVRENATIIIVGETGSGKTTQIPQYLIEDGLALPGSVVGVTQPRRVAATSLATRVSSETGTTLGNKVGFSVRFQHQFNPSTGVLKFLTDGMLLRELISDPMLSSYSAIVLDEAHERTVRTDVLFGMVKGVQRKRRDLLESGAHIYPEDNSGAKLRTKKVKELKIIIMSATLDAEKFSRYFNDAPALHIPGRQHPVEIFSATEPQADYLDAAVMTTLQIHLTQAKGDVLVFLTGQDEIETVATIITEHAAQLPPDKMQLLVCPLFAALPAAQQATVFDPAPENTRKVILATNIAETSITISGVRYVIDPGFSKMRGFNAKIGIESLTVQKISRASARQRTGRAGREAPGVCFRLYTEDAFFDDLVENTEPEISRCNLTSVILTLKAAGVDDPVNFDYMDKPSRASLLRALEGLYALEAIGGDGGRLTDLGRLMAEFPIDPKYAKALIKSKDFGCTREVIDIVSLLSTDTIFFNPNDRREEAAEARKKFRHPEGDHLTLLSVLRLYQQVNGDVKWCRDHFINMRNMKLVLDVRKQLNQLCAKHDISPDLSCGHDTDSILRAFLSGFFQNTALLQPDSTYKSVVGGRTVNVHPSSVLFGKKTEAIVFDEMVFTTKQYVRGVSAVQGSWIAQAAPRLFGNV